MQEIHNSDCGNNAGGRSLSHNVINQGYYWHKIFENTKGYMKKYPQC